jgi:hypothetical protein
MATADPCKIQVLIFFAPTRIRTKEVKNGLDPFIFAERISHLVGVERSGTPIRCRKLL